MSKWFKNLRLQNKVLALLIIPSLVLLAAFVKNFNHEINESKQIETLNQRTLVSLDLGLLIHEFQLQRGFSKQDNTYLPSNCSIFS